MSRGVVRSVGLALACLGAAACGSQGTSHTVQPTQPVTTRTNPVLGSTIGNVSSNPSCATSQLAVTLHAVAGLGHGGDVIDFRNRGKTCALYGYPGVDGLDLHGRVVVSAKRTLRGYLGGLGPGVTEKPVVLGSGQTASAMLEGFNAPKPSAPCRHYSSLAITPPNETHSLHLASAFSLCYPQIHPVVPGASGQEQ